MNKLLSIDQIKKLRHNQEVFIHSVRNYDGKIKKSKMRAKFCNVHEVCKIEHVGFSYKKGYMRLETEKFNRLKNYYYTKVLYDIKDNIQKIYKEKLFIYMNKISKYEFIGG